VHPAKALEPAKAAKAAEAGKPAKAAKAAKARIAAECMQLEQLPNVGQSIAGDLRLIGVQHPQELATRDALELYHALCRASGQRQDPCVLDTFMAITDFMRGAAAAPWWAYTPRRKRLHPGI